MARKSGSDKPSFENGIMVGSQLKAAIDLCLAALYKNEFLARRVIDEQQANLNCRCYLCSEALYNVVLHRLILKAL
jgi:PP-loop superfamily ATP-utilizing enzyme